MPCDDPDLVEVQVIADVLETVEARLRERELCGWRLTVPRSRVYAAVLHAVIVSARASHRIPATLDRADILDAIFDGIEPTWSGSGARPVEDVIRSSTVHVN
ncbi:hypothetical protein [Nocardia huaxiensis]|uniref:Uncharacterized protein n=1 Tax=Nocardia huaxiensis TaxID=2755382 RepID=A0A7D6V8P0_9NOCA|nr:hypothetical protein [Nocardia huaxiensis]QLY28362.1 hypothetical protein H0264_23630 [Nocardia huaxiensis]UFS98192.1 hypothetical protein LPY97_10005 [Nocardia huaxiensis]